MSDMTEAIRDFLAQKRIAVAGVSRTRRNAANIIYRKLRSTGYTVYAVNPHAGEVEGDRCYPDIQSITNGVDALMIATSPRAAEGLVRQCPEAGVSRVWMHQSLRFAGTSVSPEAVQFCRDHNIIVIPGGCPMMFCEPVDFGHKCVRWLSRVTGSLPTPSPGPQDTRPD